MRKFLCISENVKGLNIFNSWVTRGLGWLGGQVADYPKLFIIATILGSLALGTGLIKVKYENDPEYLYTPTNGQSKQEQAILDEFFKANYSWFNPSRPNKIGRFVRIIVEANDGETILRSSIWNDILEVNQTIHEASINWNGQSLNYSDICASWDGVCFENEILHMGDIMDQIENDSIHVNYPLMFDPVSFRTYTFPHFFGGIVKNESTNFIEKVEALQLNYILAVDNIEDDKRGLEWENEIIDYLEKAENSKRWKNIKVYKMTYNSFVVEQEKNFLSVIPYFAVTIVLMGCFTMTSASMSDWVKGKPWLGVIAMISAGFGTLAGFGIASYMGVYIIGMNIAVPFIMLGIGIDDSFVMLAAWRRTSIKDSVRKRLSDTYSEAAVSITITTLTDALSFYVGVLSPIPSVQSFSAYAGTCAIAIYFIQILFFGGILAISGEHESKNGHSLFLWKKATPKSIAEDEGKPKLFLLFLTGGINPEDPTNPKDNSESAVMKFFRDTFSPWLMTKPVKFFVILLFFAYIGVAGYGLTNIDEGLRLERLFSYDSYLAKFIEKESEYFRTYPHRIQVLITSQHDYFDQFVQNQTLSLISELQDTPYTTREFSENWLDSFLRYKKNYEEWNEFNITNREDFMELLITEFLPARKSFAQDVIFNENKTEIIATRYIIQSYKISSASGERDLLNTLREILKDKEDTGNATGIQYKINYYHPWAAFADQFIMIRSLAIQLVAIAAVIVMFVSITLIPNLMCAFWVLFSIVSIEIGVLGFMSLWGVALDLISIINLLMCIGFSVDFSAHITYTFTKSTGSPEERVSNSLYALGLPICQAAISSIIGVAALTFVPSYIFLAFLKIIFLVILFAALHALFILPVMFSIFGKNSQEKKNEAEMTEK